MKFLFPWIIYELSYKAVTFLLTVASVDSFNQWYIKADVMKTV